MLFQYSLNRNGDDTNAQGGGKPNNQQGDDEAHALIRESIKRELKHTQETAMSELTYAASVGHQDIVTHLLAMGLPINKGDHDRRTPLHVAVAEGKDAVVRALLAKGAKVDVVDDWGSTPLFEAFEYDKMHIAEMLVNSGAKVASNSFRQVKAAAVADDAKLTLMCLKAGANPNSSDYDQRSVLHTCCASRDLRAVESLLGIGANPNIKDRCERAAFLVCGACPSSWPSISER